MEKDLTTIVIGNRWSDRLLNFPDKEEAQREYMGQMEARQKETVDPFFVEKRTLMFLATYDLIHRDHNSYVVTSDYTTAKWYIGEKMRTGEPFDTTFIYRLINLDLWELKGKDEDEVKNTLINAETAHDIILNSKGLVTILAKHKDELDDDIPLDFYQYFMVNELIKDRIPGLIVSYCRNFSDIIAINDDIARDPDRYHEATDKGALEIRSHDDLLNRTVEELRRS